MALNLKCIHNTCRLWHPANCLYSKALHCQSESGSTLRNSYSYQETCLLKLLLEVQLRLEKIDFQMSNVISAIKSVVTNASFNPWIKHRCGCYSCISSPSTLPTEAPHPRTPTVHSPWALNKQLLLHSLFKGAWLSSLVSQDQPLFLKKKTKK